MRFLGDARDTALDIGWCLLGDVLQLSKLVLREDLGLSGFSEVLVEGHFPGLPCRRDGRGRSVGRDGQTRELAAHQ